MSTNFDLVYGAVLAGALMNAGWNALIKGSADTLLSTVGITTWSALLAICLLPWLPQPVAASWPFILLSLVLQVTYMRMVARIYRTTDMSVAYPVMRGTAPFLVATISILFLRETLSPLALVGIAAICGGILCIGLRPRKRPGATAPASLRLPLLNATVIAGYTLVDGSGVRLSEAPAAYTLWIFVAQGLVMAVMGLRSRRRELLPYLRAHWAVGCIGGIGSVISYVTALWAMTLAPIPVIAALRETSILFGILISGLILRERLTAGRILGACVLVLGAMLLRLG